MNRHLSLSLLAAGALLLATGSAHADDPPPCAAEAEAVKQMKQRDPSLAYPTDETAKTHLDHGKRAFGVGEYDKAIDNYTAAGLIDDAPLILYNLGQTYRAMKDYERAIRQYKLFLERGKAGAEVRALVECHVATMTAEMEHAASTAPPTGPAPDPGLTGPADGAPATSDEPTTTTHPSRWTTMRKASLGVGATGIVVVAAGVVFGIQSRGYKDDAAELCPSDPCANADEANVFSDKASSRATLANVSFGVGAGAIIGAAVLWYLGAPSSSGSESDEAAIVPHVSGDFVGLAYSARF